MLPIVLPSLLLLLVLATDPGEVALGAPPKAQPDGAAVRYGRDVRPLLADRCFACHGADSGSRQAGLRLDLRDGALALRAGVAALVPGDAAASELVRRIQSHDPDTVMPPPSAKKRPLDEAERAALVRWIEEGAGYERHWAFESPVAHGAPAVVDNAWPRGEIDRFILARLESAGLAPAAEADGATLARRAYLELTGLPPTPEELDAFLAHPDPLAFEALVQRLLTEEPWRSRGAEHRASAWLDAARYADTIGIHTDNGRQLWPWRDWVLEALRDNLPFDRFVTEQLAGDLLPDASVAQRVATGFHRAHIITDEGGAIPDEYLVEYAADRVETTGKVFLGLTLGCARCHDHKFDPVSMEDYYGLFAYFNSIEEPGLYSQTPDARRAYEPFLSVPSAQQTLSLSALEVERDDLLAAMEAEVPGEDQARQAFVADMARAAGVFWTRPQVLSARSTDERVSLQLQDDGSLLASGPMPESEDYEITLSLPRGNQRALLLECLSTPGADTPGVGRAFHGNVVLSNISLAQRAAGSDDGFDDVPLNWIWADHSQRNRDYAPGNALDHDPVTGWAADGNEAAGPRTLMLLAAEPFGSDDGAELQLVLAFRSPFEQHSLGRLAVSVSPLADTSLLPVIPGRMHRLGPFGSTVASEAGSAYDTLFGPELSTRLDRSARFGEQQRMAEFFGEFEDGVPALLGNDLAATYLVRRLWSPDARLLPVSLGSDDGLAVWLNGEQVFENRVDRGVAADQDSAVLPLRAGHNLLVLKVVNTGGPGGAYFLADPPEGVLADDLVSALLPQQAVTERQAGEFALTWRRMSFAGWRQLDDARASTEQRMAELRAQIPTTMVMAEMAEPRPAHVLTRGQYDHPDESRPVGRAPPAFLPAAPADAPSNRLGLARWLTEPGHPLFARVAVNRVWEQLFGTGLVATSDDFGQAGSWPSHPELLDTLAVRFQESGWDIHALIASIVTSATWRQGSRERPELSARDPDDRLLGRFPPRRLSAEQIRDLALFASGLLVERLGGPSVKPYQPDGLWREVAMVASNTRTFERDDGDGLWRRSLYTYWKRAVPPPALQTFDAPTRESCVVNRPRTSTPLQSLVLWNDVQFVEAARVLAARTLAGLGTDDARLAELFRRCTAREPNADEAALLEQNLQSFRARFEAVPQDAEALLAEGEAALPMGVSAPELAAFTMVASAVLNLHETLTQH